MKQTLSTDVKQGATACELSCLPANPIEPTVPADEEQRQLEFLERVNGSISEVQLLAEKTFSSLADQLAADGVARAVVSAASTHATLGGNLATTADSVARAVVSAASTHATLGGNLATTADSVARAVVSAASTHATLGGNLATTADGVARAVVSAASTNVDNLVTAPIAGTNLVENEYIGYFRTLVMTMLGELPRKGHLTSDFDEMFHINYQKSLSQADFREMESLMCQVTDDWTSDAFLTEAPEVIRRMRSHLLEIATRMDITEKIPSSFTEDDLAIIPHISLLNDFLNQLLRAMGVVVPTYQDGIKDNPGILDPAKKIVSSHRAGDLPLAYKMLRTALLENTAQARIQGLKTIANNYGLGGHVYLTTHDIVEEYHGRDSLEELTTFVHSGHTPVEILDAHLTQIVGEISAFYASMSQCAQVTRLEAHPA